jgi:hypothetical protein
VGGSQPSIIAIILSGWRENDLGGYDGVYIKKAVV